MPWWQNIPFLSLLLCLLSAAVCFVLPSRASRIWSRSVLGLCAAGAALLLFFLLRENAGPFTYMMGHFPAPWGNEIRCGVLEALLAALFPLIMLCALVSGSPWLSGAARGVSSGRESACDALCMLLSAALLAQIYSNDLFTCYVFVEIMTLTACALIVFRGTGKALAAAMRYMVMNLVGSGLFLLGVVLLYDLTGHLLMEYLHTSIRALVLSGRHQRSLTLILALITSGLGIKSALFPFHSWVPDAYSSGVPSSNAIVSSLVSKGYILLLMKIYARVFGWDAVLASRVDLVLLLFAMAGMIFGSLAAIRTRDFLRMTAWSSVAQIGYIYLGIGLGAGAGYQAALFHLIVHAFSKALLFLAGGHLLAAAGGAGDLESLSGAARRKPWAGGCWTLAACALTGLPFTGGLVSKLLLGQEALRHSLPVAAAVLAVLALSTLLNVLYFLRTAMILWSPEKSPAPAAAPPMGSPPVTPAPRFPLSAPALGLLALGILLTFLLASPLLEALETGLIQF